MLYILIMERINGKEIAAKILADLKSKPVPKKFLAIFLVGNDPASINFIGQKEKIAKELGVDFRLYKYEEDLSNDELRKKISKIVNAKKCGGAIIQLPLPKHLNPLYVLNAIPYEKDVECLAERAAGAFYHNRSLVLPPAVAVVQEIFDYFQIDTSKIKEVSVLGQGLLIGKPFSNWAIEKFPQVISLRNGSDLSLIKNSDLIICGTGQTGILKEDMIKKGSIVIDFGYGIDGKTGKMTGDLDIVSLKNESLSFYTPTPGGTGPILVASLMKNFYKLNSVD